MIENSSRHEGFKTSKEAPNKWEYWEKLNPKIREALANHAINFGIYSTWQLQVKHGVKYTLQRLNTRALELTVCEVPPLGVNYKWVMDKDYVETP